MSAFRISSIMLNGRTLIHVRYIKFMIKLKYEPNYM